MSARAVIDRAYRVPVIKPSDAGKVPFDLLPAKLLIFGNSALFPRYFAVFRANVEVATELLRQTRCWRLGLFCLPTSDGLFPG